MTEIWRRPTTEESNNGFVAMFAYYYNSALPKSEWRWLGYTVKMMNRRVARNGALPYWITRRPATVAQEYVAIVDRLNDLDYWLENKVSGF